MFHKILLFFYFMKKLKHIFDKFFYELSFQYFYKIIKISSKLN